MSDLQIVVPIYKGVDMIDVAAPIDVLSRIPQFWSERLIDIKVVAETMDPVITGQGVALNPMATLDDAEPNVLLVPGARDVSPASSSAKFMDFLRVQGARAEYVTSVCTGALLLGYAGLLDGYRATTHWLALPELQKIQGVAVVNGYPRWVQDRNRFTAGGVSSSLDAAIKLVAILTGSDDVARRVQLLIQYHPSPPYDCGDPAVADYETWRAVAGG